MKDEKDIRLEVEATMGLLDELIPSVPPAGLAERVMARVTAEGRPAVRLPRRQSRIAWVAAAAAVVLAINVFTLLRLERKASSSSISVQGNDPIEDIRSEYSLDNNLY